MPVPCRGRRRRRRGGCYADHHTEGEESGAAHPRRLSSDPAPGQLTGCSAPVGASGKGRGDLRCGKQPFLETFAFITAHRGRKKTTGRRVSLREGPLPVGFDSICAKVNSAPYILGVSLFKRPTNHKTQYTVQCTGTYRSEDGGDTRKAGQRRPESRATLATAARYASAHASTGPESATAAVGSTTSTATLRPPKR